MSMTIVSSGSIRVAASRAMASLLAACRLLRVAKSPSRGPDRERAAVDPLEQAPVPQPAQVAADRLQRHAELPREFLGGDRLRLAKLGEDGLAALSRQHTAPE